MEEAKAFDSVFKWDNQYKLLCQKALDAMETEYRQLEHLDVFEPEHAHTLAIPEKKAALRAIDLIKIKRSGKIKGRTVADGSTQRAYISKEDSTSPAAHLDSLIATLVVDAMENREVATADVAGAYLKVDMPDTVFLRVEIVQLRPLMPEDIFTYTDPMWRQSKENPLNYNQHMYLHIPSFPFLHTFGAGTPK